MGEDSVKIPISLEVDKKELNSLKADIEATFNDIARYERSFSTKKQPFKLVDISQTKEQIDAAISEIGRLQKEFATVSRDTPMNRWKDTFHNISDLIKQNKADAKALASEYSRLGNSSKNYKKSLEDISTLEAKIAKSQAKYAEDKAKIDTSQKGSKKQLRELDAQHKQEQEALKDQLSRANIAKLAAKANIANAKEEIAALKGARTERDAQIARMRVQAQQLGTLAKSEEYITEQEKERVARLKEINAQLAEQRDIVEGLQAKSERQFIADQRKTGRTSGDTDKHAKAVEAQTEKVRREAERQAKIREDVLREEQRIRRAIDAENQKAAERETQQIIDNKNREISALRQTASQYYYKLRSVKMFGFALKQVTNTVVNFEKKAVSGATKALVAYLKLIPGVNALRRAFDKTHSSQKKFNKEMKNTHKTTSLANMSLGKFILNLIKATIGVRSIYMLFRKLRKAIGEGFNSMAVQLDDVNAQLSSIVTSFNYMKAAVTAVVQPILNALAPALEQISNAFEQVAFYASSFIAVLTGQSYVYRAIKVQTDYAESLDKTANSAKNAAKELGKYDKLNVIKKDNDSNNTGGMQWEKVPVDDVIKGWSEKFKSFFDDLFSPLKTAWDKVKNYVIKSWKEAITQLKLLFKDMAEDFFKVWKEAETEKIFENLLVVLADIGRIVANLAHNFREAWNENENGYRILASIRDAVLIISEGLKDAADYTVKWSRELTFIPALNSLADNMEQKLVPAVEKVKDLFVILYEQAVLKIVRDFIERGLPQLIDLLGTVIEIVGIIAEKVREAWQSGSNGIGIINNIEVLLQIVVNKVKECADKTKEWSENLDFKPLMQSIKQFLEDIQPLIEFVSNTIGKLWTDVLLPFYQYLIEKGFPLLLDTVGKIVGETDWASVTENMNNLMDALKPFFELTWETLVIILGDLLRKISEFAESDELGTIIDKFKDWVEDADPEDLAKRIEHLVVSMVAITAVLKLFSEVIVPAVTNFMTFRNFFLQGTMAKQIKNLQAEIAALKGEEAASTGIAGLTAKLGGLAPKVEKATQVIKVLPEAFKLIQQPFTVFTGLIASLIGSFEALSGGFDMMENGFSIGGESATLFGSILTGVGLIVGGAGAWPAIIAAAVLAILSNLGAFGDKLLDWVLNTAADIQDKIGEFFSDLGYNFGVWVGTAIKNLKADLDEKLEAMSKPENWLEFGINILKGILAIFLLPARLIGWIITAVANFFEGMSKGLNDAFDMHSPSKKMEPFGENILKGLLNGILAVVKTIGTWLKTNVVDPIFNVYKKYFTLQALKDNGTKFITGLQNAIKTGISKLVSYLPNSIKNIISKFKEKLTSNTLVNIGKNLLSGLKEGIEEGLSKLLGTVKNVGTTVIDTFKDIFDINSPSGVTEDFGINLMKGLSKGVDEESDDDLLPTEFTDNFLDSLNDMRVDALDIISSMIDDINDKMEKLNFMEKLNTQMAKVSSIKVPDIAIGSVLPANVEFKQSTNKLDEKTLDKVIRNAISDIVAELNTDSNKEPIMLQLDKRVVAEAVWDEENKRYKQRGSYTPSYV